MDSWKDIKDTMYLWKLLVPIEGHLVCYQPFVYIVRKIFIIYVLELSSYTFNLQIVYTSSNNPKQIYGFIK